MADRAYMARLPFGAALQPVSDGVKECVRESMSSERDWVDERTDLFRAQLLASLEMYRDWPANRELVKMNAELSCGFCHEKASSGKLMVRAYFTVWWLCICEDCVAAADRSIRTNKGMNVRMVEVDEYERLAAIRDQARLVMAAASAQEWDERAPKLRELLAQGGAV